MLCGSFDIVKLAWSDCKWFLLGALCRRILNFNIDVYKDRDNIAYDNVAQAMEKVEKKGYGEVLVVTTYVINGEEYDHMAQMLKAIATY